MKIQFDWETLKLYLICTLLKLKVLELTATGQSSAWSLIVCLSIEIYAISSINRFRHSFDPKKQPSTKGICIVKAKGPSIRSICAFSLTSTVSLSLSVAHSVYHFFSSHHNQVNCVHSGHYYN